MAADVIRIYSWVGNSPNPAMPRRQLHWEFLRDPTTNSKFTEAPRWPGLKWRPSPNKFQGKLISYLGGC